MRHITKQEEVCKTCNHITTYEDYYETCDYCNKKLGKNNESFEWNIINGKDDYHTAEPKFCSITHAMLWLRKSYKKYAKTHEKEDSFYSLCYLRSKDMLELLRNTKAKIGDKE